MPTADLRGIFCSLCLSLYNYFDNYFFKIFLCGTQRTARVTRCKKNNKNTAAIEFDLCVIHCQTN